MRSRFRETAAVALALAAATQTAAQQQPDIGFDSVGRGAPLAARLPSALPPTQPEQTDYLLSETPIVGPLLIHAYFGVGDWNTVRLGSAWDGEAPEGIEPLPVDVFTSDDFYADRALWGDRRYWRCNSPMGLEAQHNALNPNAGPGPISDGDSTKAAWGYCDNDHPREAIVSPYGFASAEAHYDALLAETRARGGPTAHDYASVPGELSGRYTWNDTAFTESWYAFMVWSQTPTILSLLTPEYQTRMVQQLYHTGNTDAAHWPVTYCWPEGFMRRFYGLAVIGSPHQVVVTPDLVQISTGSAANFVTNIHIGREFDRTGSVPRLGADVPRWYGETIGFWDQDVLITWTSNIQGWTAHGAFEFSSQMQTVEIYTPLRDAAGGVTGINHETILYDPEALAEPIRIVRNLARSSGLDEGAPTVFIECTLPYFPIEGRMTAVTPGETIEYVVPDLYGRPWAELWERHFEEGMSAPEDEDLFSFE